MSDRKWYLEFLKSKDRNVILICVGIALLLWLTTTLSKDYTHEYRFTLEFDLPENRAFTATPPDQLRASLSGQGWELFQASFKRKFRHLHIPVPPTDNDISRSDLIQALYEHLGGYEVQVREVNVDIIQLDTDIRQSKSVPVITGGRPVIADGYVMLDSVRFEPGEVILSGPASALERIDVIRVELPELVDIQTSIARTLSVTSPVAYVTVEPKSVDLLIDVDEEIEIAFEVPVTVISDSIPVRVDPSRVNISLRTGKTLGQSIDASQIRVFSDVAAAESGRIALHAEVPNYAYQVVITPPTVSVVQDSLNLREPD